MDKILGIFTTIFVGIPLTVISFLISRYMDDDGHNQTTLPDDSDVRTYVPSRCRNRSCDNRHDKQVEEVKELAKKLNVKIGGNGDDKESK